MKSRSKAPMAAPQSNAHARRGLTASLGLLAISLAGLLGASAPAGAADASCENSLIREQQHSTFLPECRAYEMISPAAKNGNDIAFGRGLTQIAEDGSQIMFQATGAFGDAAGTGFLGASAYLATRGGNEEWSTHGITPAQAPDSFSGFRGAGFAFHTPDLKYSIVWAYDPSLTADAPAEFRQLYLRDNQTGIFQLLMKQDSPLTPGFGELFNRPNFTDATPDLSHITFESTLNLTSDASGEQLKLYEWVDGVVRLASILPDGEPASAEASAAYRANSVGEGVLTDTTISDDGSKVFFTSPSSSTGGPLYMRTDGTSTVLVNASENTLEAVPVGSAIFRGATPDGTRVFFTSEQKLVDADVNESSDLYAYDTTLPAGDPNNLTLISVDSEPADSAPVDANGVIGYSNDGSIVYFTAGGNLVPGQYQLDSQQRGIYVWDDGEIRLVAPIESQEGAPDARNYRPALQGVPRPSRVSHDGKMLLYTTTEPPLDGYDNAGLQQIYTYDLDADQVTCVSCRPDGLPSTAGAELINDQITPVPESTFQTTHLMLEDGTVFFQSGESLAQGDVNGKMDAYMWRDGRAWLLSSGRSARDSYFQDATPDGSSIVIATAAALVPRDIDQNMDLYELRVDGGIAEPPATAPGCSGDECQGVPQSAPADPAPASGSLTVPTGDRGSRPDARCVRLGSRAKELGQQARQLKRRSARASGKKASRLAQQGRQRQEKSAQLTRRAKACKKGNS